MQDAAAFPPHASLFIGLWPDAATRAAVVDHRRDWAWPPGVSMTSPERLHLTLHFLGLVPRERIPVLVQGIGVDFEPFDLTLRQPTLWAGGIAVLRPAAAPKPLLALHERLLHRLEALGQFPVRQQLEPHVTLARKAQQATPPSHGASIEWLVDGYVLVETALPPPDRYRVIAHYP